MHKRIRPSLLSPPPEGGPSYDKSHHCSSGHFHKMMILFTLMAIALFLGVTNVLYSTHTTARSSHGFKQRIRNENVAAQPLEVEKVCKPDPSRNHQKFHQDNVTMDRMFDNPDYDRRIGTAAVCSLHLSEKLSMHFPHQMQRLYPCFSHWNYHKGKQRYLVDSTGAFDTIEHYLQSDSVVNQTGRYSEFFHGVARVLINSLGVKVVKADNITKSIDGAPIVYPTHRTGTDSNSQQTWFASPRDAHDLRDAILAYYNLAPVKCDNTQDRNSASNLIRVGILNRHNTREILNAGKLVSKLRTYFSSVVLVTLDDKTFQEQVQFFSTVDILIAPHGAGLTGLPFMPNCGAVVEIFPQGYFLPGYFGTLASNSGLLYSYMYMSLGDAVEETNATLQTHLSRRTARRQNVCPDTTKIMNAVWSAVERRRDCSCD